MKDKRGREMNNSRRRRGPTSRAKAEYRDLPQYKRSGSHSCSCGRTISANKSACLGCA